MRKEASKACQVCQKQTLHAKEVTSGATGCVLLLIAAGAGFLLLGHLGCIAGAALGMAVTALAIVSDFTKKYRCQQCGSEN